MRLSKGGVIGSREREERKGWRTVEGFEDVRDRKDVCRGVRISRMLWRGERGRR